MRSVRLFAALVAVSVVFAPAAGAQQTEVGTTAATNTDTTGTPPGLATRNLFIGTNVFFEERIETSKSGQAQLLFLDESALTIASNSDVVLDKFIYDPKTSKGELALSIGAGVFRFVGGRISKTSMVTIKTPTATLGIRGGIVIIKVEPGTGATRATFVFGKEMTVTNKSGVTVRVTRPGFSVDVASQDDPPSSPFKVSGGVIASYLTELEGRTGQTAGLTEPLTDVQVADSGIDEVGSSTDPEDIVTEETAATGGTGGTDGGDPTDPIDPNNYIDPGNINTTQCGENVENCTTTNVALVAADDTTTTSANAAVIISVLANDSGDSLTITGFTQGVDGTVVDNSDGTLTYTYTSNLGIFTGTDSFTYTVTDANGDSVTSTVTVTVTAVFAGRFKTEATGNEFLGLGTEDGDPAFDIPFSGASVVDIDGQDFLTAPSIGLLLPTSGPAVVAPQGFTGFSFDGTGTSSPFDELVGEGFLSDDSAFIFYQTIDNDNFLDFIFAGIPTPSFPNSGITAYLLEPDFVLGSNVPFIRGLSGGGLAVPAPGVAAIDWGNGIFAGALVAIDAQGVNQISAASLFGGSVVTGTQATADLVGLMRGSTRDSFSDVRAHFFDSAVELSRDGDGNAFFGSGDPDYFVFQSDGGATEDFAGSTTTYFPNVVAHVDTTETFGARTTRTLNGFSGGMFQLVNGSGLLLGNSIFGNTTGDPGDIQIDTVAANGTLTANFDVASSSQPIVADFGGTGVSAFFDDESFGALEASATSAEFDGATVTNALLYMVTDVLEGGGSGFLPAGVNFCLCEFLQWGFWGGDLELASGDHVRVHLANWVAGEVSALSEIALVLGSATYTGHAIGTVNNDGSIYQAVGGFSQTYDFAIGSGTVNITDFDDVSYTGITVNAKSVGQENLFTGTATFTTPARTINLNGAFFGSAPVGDPPPETGGGFNITGSGYEASGIFAGAK